jgi:hypothetical protein
MLFATKTDYKNGGLAQPTIKTNRPHNKSWILQQPTRAQENLSTKATKK